MTTQNYVSYIFNLGPAVIKSTFSIR